MKTFQYLTICLLAAFLPLIVFAQDDVYDYTQPQSTTTTDGSGNTYVTNNYYNTDNNDEQYVFANDDEYEYYYSSRLRRFHNPVQGSSYYSGYYVDRYWYDPNPFFWGQTIYYDPFAVSYYYSPVIFIRPRPWWAWGWNQPQMFNIYYGNPYGGGWGNNWGWGCGNGWNNNFYNPYNPWNGYGYGYGYGYGNNITVINNYGPYYTGDNGDYYGGKSYGPRQGKDTYGNTNANNNTGNYGIYPVGGGTGIRPDRPSTSPPQGGKSDGIGISVPRGNTTRPDRNNDTDVKTPKNTNPNSGFTPNTNQPNTNQPADVRPDRPVKVNPNNTFTPNTKPETETVRPNKNTEPVKNNDVENNKIDLPIKQNNFDPKNNDQPKQQQEQVTPKSEKTKVKSGFEMNEKSKQQKSPKMDKSDRNEGRSKSNNFNSGGNKSSKSSEPRATQPAKVREFNSNNNNNGSKKESKSDRKPR